MNRYKYILILIIISISTSCKTGNTNIVPDIPDQPIIEESIDFTFGDEGVEYIWDESVIPEIHISISLDEWNKLLKEYDKNNHIVDYFHCDVDYIKGGEKITIEDAGVRLRGNTSRRRPEGVSGEAHKKDNADWHHCHFGLNFRKFNKDDEHELKGIRKINLKWFKDDPCYVRELYCYDLFRRYNIWTAANDTYCRLWIHVEGDSKEAYFGVYQMIEPVDSKFISKRKEYFGSEDGNLWKCGYPATFRDINASIGLDEDKGIDYVYEYKGDEEDYDGAVAQLKDFMLKLQGKSDESFYKWIKEVCDVEFLLKTYAVNVAVGMWDDHWNNGNNFYIYFNSYDLYNYKVFFIPYDYDNSLGTSSNCENINDSGRHNPYDWGEKGLLMERLMKFEEFRKIYKDALLELVDPENELFDMNASIKRIQYWHNKISKFVSNDTGEDMIIEDKPAFWGNHSEYRLIDSGVNNFFRVKEESIRIMD